MADPSSYRPAAGTIPTAPGVYKFRDAAGRVVYVGKAKSLRQRLSSYFQDVDGAAPAHPPDGHHGGGRRVDGRADRGRGAAARVLVDQAVRPALQRQVPRRQELPEPRGDRGGGVPAAAGHARAEEEGRALLRAVRPRLGDPRDARPAAARLPGAHLQQGRLRPRRARSAGRACSATSTSAAPLRRQGVARAAPRDRRRLLRLPGRAVDAVPQAARARDGRGRRAAGVRAGGAAARRHRRAHAGDGEAGRRARPTPPTPTSSRSPRTSSRRRSRSSTSAAAGSAGSTATSSTRSRTSPTGELVGQFLAQAYGDDPEQGFEVELDVERRAEPGAGFSCATPTTSRARCSSRPCRPTPRRCRLARRPARHQRRPARAAARRQEGADGDRRAQRQAGVRAAQDQAGERPHRAQHGAGRDPGGARARRGAAADRVLRRLPHPGHRRRRVDGGLRGRARPQERVPPLRRPRHRRRRRHRVACARSSAAASPATSRSSARRRGAAGPRSTPRPAGRAASPTRRSSSSSTAGSRRSPPRRPRSTSSASSTSRSAGWPSGSRRCGCPATTTR